jgi:hypothetical protein
MQAACIIDADGEVEAADGVVVAAEWSADAGSDGVEASVVDRLTSSAGR